MLSGPAMENGANLHAPMLGCTHLSHPASWRHNWRCSPRRAFVACWESRLRGNAPRVDITTEGLVKQNTSKHATEYRHRHHRWRASTRCLASLPSVENSVWAAGGLGAVPPPSLNCCMRLAHDPDSILFSVAVAASSPSRRHLPSPTVSSNESEFAKNFI